MSATVSHRALPVVFLGSSLPLAEARQLLAADYRPPVRRGDFEDLPVDAPVLIVDGEFGQTLSVSPKEIWRFIQRGGHVLGAASMGALRAVELEPMGMVGLGWIYEAYRSAKVVGDDEVALIYSPIDYRPLTVPLINVRYWLEVLTACRALPPFRAARALAAARKVHFSQRFPDALFEALSVVLERSLLETLLTRTGGILDVKASDCRLALRELAALEGKASLDLDVGTGATKWRTNLYRSASTNCSVER